jgi:hypothetical protein
VGTQRNGPGAVRPIDRYEAPSGDGRLARVTYPPPQDPWQPAPRRADPPTELLPVVPPYPGPAGAAVAADGAATGGRLTLTAGRKVLVGFVGLLVLCCCGGGIGAALMNSDDDRSVATATTGPAQAVVESPLAAEPDAAEPNTPSAGPVVPSRTERPTPSATRTSPRPAPTRSSSRPTPRSTTGAPRTTAPADPAIQSGVRAGAFCKPAGALGRTDSGKLMMCRTSAKDSRLRWRALV